MGSIGTPPAVRPDGDGRPGDGAGLDPSGRVERGRTARLRAPRSTQAALDDSVLSRDPVALLEQQARDRVPELVPLRYGRMLASPFSFFRGAALVMAHDLARTPRTGIGVQLCGDAHLSNFGLFGSPERRLVFDLNDFDETHPGPWEWDVKRLVTSLVVAGRDNGFGGRDRRSVAEASARRYREAMREFAGQGNLEVWYASVDAEKVQREMTSGLGSGQRKRLDRTVAKARHRDSVQAVEKLTETVDGKVRIVADPPVTVPITDLLPDVERHRLEGHLRTLLTDYAATLSTDRRVLLAQYRMVDAARKVVGVGSVGTRAWILLMRGRDSADPLFLQAKEAQRSVLAGFLDHPPFPNEGERVVTGQRLMQSASDIFLGWQHVTGIDGRPRDFYLRQLRDWKGSATVETMEPSAMRWYGELCGWTLARAHARSGDRIAIAAYLGSGQRFDRAVAEFAETYADQNERDHEALRRAVETGRVRAAVEKDGEHGRAAAPTAVAGVTRSPG